MQQGEVQTSQDYQQKTYYSRPEQQSRDVNIDIQTPDIDWDSIIFKKDIHSAVDTAINSVISSLVWKGVGAGISKIIDALKGSDKIGEHNEFKAPEFKSAELQQRMKPEGREAFQNDLNKLKSPLDTVKQFGEEMKNEDLKVIGDSGLKAIDSIQQTLNVIESSAGAIDLLRKAPQLIDDVKKYTKTAKNIMSTLDYFSSKKSVIHQGKVLLDTAEGKAKYLDEIKKPMQDIGNLLTKINEGTNKFKDQYARIKNIFKPTVTAADLRKARVADFETLAEHDLYSTTGKEYFRNTESLMNSKDSLQDLVKNNKSNKLAKNIQDLNTIYKALPDVAEQLKRFNDSPAEFVKKNAEQILSYNPKFIESQIAEDKKRDLNLNKTFHDYLSREKIKTNYNGVDIDFAKKSKADVDKIINEHYDKLAKNPEAGDGLLLQQEIFQDQYQFNPEFRQLIDKNYSEYEPLKQYNKDKQAKLARATSPMNILRNADLANYDLSDLSETLNNYHSHHPLNTVSSYLADTDKGKELTKIPKTKEDIDKLKAQMPKIQDSRFFTKYGINENMIDQRIEQLEKSTKLSVKDELDPIKKEDYNRYIRQVEDQSAKNLLYYQDTKGSSQSYRHILRTPAEIESYKKKNYPEIYKFEQDTGIQVAEHSYEDIANTIRDKNLQRNVASQNLADNQKELADLRDYQKDVKFVNKNKRFVNLLKDDEYLKDNVYYQQLMDLYSGKRYIKEKPLFQKANAADSADDHQFIIRNVIGEDVKVNPASVQEAKFEKGGKIIPKSQTLTNELSHLYNDYASKLSAAKSVDFEPLIKEYESKYEEALNKQLLAYPKATANQLETQILDEFNKQHPNATLEDVALQFKSTDFPEWDKLNDKQKTKYKRTINSRHKKGDKKNINYKKEYNDYIRSENRNMLNQKLADTQFTPESFEEFKNLSKQLDIKNDPLENVSSTRNGIINFLKSQPEYADSINKIDSETRQGFKNVQISGKKYYPDFNKTFKLDFADSNDTEIVKQYLKDSLADLGLAGSEKSIDKIVKSLPKEQQDRFFTQNKNIIDNISPISESDKDLQNLKKLQYNLYGYKPNDYQYIIDQLQHRLYQKFADKEVVNKALQEVQKVVSDVINR